MSDKIHYLVTDVLRKQEQGTAQITRVSVDILRPNRWQIPRKMTRVAVDVLRRVPYPDAVSASDGMTRILTLQDGEYKPLRMGDALHGTDIWPMPPDLFSAHFTETF